MRKSLHSLTFVQNKYGVTIKKCPGSCSNFHEHVYIEERQTYMETNEEGESVPMEKVVRHHAIECKCFPEPHTRSEKPCPTCPYYQMKLFYVNFNPADHKGTPKPKAYWDWVKSLPTDDIIRASFDKWLATTTDGQIYAQSRKQNALQKV